MRRLLYQLSLSLCGLAVLPFLLLKRGSHYLPSLRHRLGLAELPGASGKPHLWIHAVSVGEVGVAATLAPRLPQDSSMVVTTVTPTGHQTARQRFPQAAVAYLPFDLGPPVRRFFNWFQPRLLLLTEGDLWPTVLATAQSRGVPVIVVNGRVSDRSFKRMRLVRPLLGPLFDPVDRFAMQTDADRQRLLDLGVPPDKIAVTGNIKFDSPQAALGEELAATIACTAKQRPVLVAGSTMAGEDEQILAAFEALGGGERALLLLAPRHPERWPDVTSLLRQSGLSWARRSQLEATTRERYDVVLLDSLGELAGLYSLAAAAFIGGTLVPTGGHNPLEAACFGVPVAVGPSMHNFHEIEAVFDEAAAWVRVSTSVQLADCWRRWLDEPETAAAVGARGRELIERNSGAVERTIEIIEPWLSPDGETI